MVYFIAIRLEVEGLPVDCPATNTDEPLTATSRHEGMPSELTAVAVQRWRPPDVHERRIAVARPPTEPR